MKGGEDKDVLKCMENYFVFDDFLIKLFYFWYVFDKQGQND